MKKYQSLMCTVFLCLASCGQATSEDKNSASKINQWINSMKDSPCSKLHKVTSRDDLIQQMYDTAFKDDCLYEMSNEELEKIWGIPVKQYEYFTSTKEDILQDPSNLLRNVDSPLDFYIVTSKDYIGLALKREAYKKGINTLFPEGYFSGVLTNLNKFEMSADMVEGKGLFATNYVSKPTDYIQSGYIYYKRNKLSLGNIIYIETHPYGAVLGVSFARNDKTVYLK